MSVLMRAREIGGRPVVTLDTAEDVAEVKDVLFSYASTSVVGFTRRERRVGRIHGQRACKLFLDGLHYQFLRAD